MNFSQKEKNLAIIFLVVVFLAGVLPYWGDKYSIEYLNRENGIKSELEQELQKLTADLADIENRRRVLQGNREAYLQWVQRGVVGAQDPVPWVNLMKDITLKRSLNPVEYSFRQEVDFAPGDFYLTKDSTVNFSSWEMDVSLPMLHDMDMFMFIGDLQKDADSFFLPLECSFSRLEEEFELINRPNINSECRLAWMSVKDPASNVNREQ